MIYQFYDYIFDSDRNEMRRSGEVVHVRPQVLAVLRYLLEHRHRVVSRDELFEQCWPESYVSDATLTSCLRRVREVIGQTQRGPTLIATRHRRGYQFVAEVTELAETASVMSEVQAASPMTPEGRSGTSSSAASEAAVPMAEPVAPHAALPPDVMAEPERRHLTVLSCRLADAEHFGQQLDPEDFYDLMQTFRATALAVITPYEGHVAQNIDHGILVYFGYPQAHEDAAQRAVRSGLALVEALGRAVSPGLAGGQAQVAVRVGIDSGIVLVSSGAGTGAQPGLAMGSALTRTVELSQLARPGTVVISGATAQLVDGYFDCKVVYDVALKEQLEPQVAYEVLGESTMQTRIEVGLARGLTPFVGREAELAVLRDRWTYVQEGMGQVVILRGEAGIGKSRLLHVLKELVVDEEPEPLECRCSPYHQHSALYPARDLLQRVLQVHPAASSDDHLDALEAFLQPYPLSLDESVQLSAELLSLPIPEGRYTPLTLAPQRQRERTLDLLSTLLVAQASTSPILLIVEDLHWADPSTLEFLERLMGQVPTTAILVILTCRPAFEAPWSEPTWMTSMTLNRLSLAQCYQMIEQVTSGKVFSEEVTQQLAEKMDGVPLFVEELTRTVLETGQFEETAAGYELVGELSDLSIPSTLHDSLMARLDRLETAKEIAQWGSVLGREFTYELIEHVVPHEEDVLQAGLDRLVASELMFQRGLGSQAQYRFKHALVQDVAYQSLRRRTRQESHERIAQVLASQFPETAEAQPELLAYHYTQAGENEIAVMYWQRAGHRAQQASAYQEAVAHLTQGMALLEMQPEMPERLEQELEYQVALGAALNATKGYTAPEVEHAYARAHVLCQQLGETPKLIPALRGLILYDLNRWDLEQAYQLGQQLLKLVETQPDPALLMIPYNLLGQIFYWWGAPVSAQAYHAQVLAIYNAQAHRAQALRYTVDPGVGAHIFLAWETWQLGYPDRALQHSQTALAMAQEESHPWSLAMALCGSGLLHWSRGEVLAAHERSAATITLATKQGLVQWLCVGMIVHGMTLVRKGENTPPTKLQAFFFGVRFAG
ncbi:AAA family ATPase, partial [Candidatus Entotheonella palauensis]|uniref:AAA family ATPase n=1 Tax=Candidatus Entotheonella palauensis TaxID=93172 RepID=UPI000B7D0237